MEDSQKDALDEKIVRGMIVRGMKSTLFFRLIPLTIIPLTLPFSATKRAHGNILPQTAKTPHVPVAAFFPTRNPRKHWSKCAPAAFLSSMYS
jgi:hypothetical protein